MQFPLTSMFWSLYEYTWKSELKLGQDFSKRIAPRIGALNFFYVGLYDSDFRSVGLSN